MTYGPVILDSVIKQFDFCPIHLDNALPSRRLKCVLKREQASACVYVRLREKIYIIKIF